MKTSQHNTSITGINSILLNIVTSGKPIDVRDGRKMIIIGRYTLLNFLVVMAAILLVLFFVLDSGTGSPYIIPIIVILAVIVCSSFFIARTNAPFIVPATLIVFVYWLFCIVIAQTGIAGISSIIWAVALPPMAIFLLGNRFGTVVSFALFGVLAASVVLPELPMYEYPIDYLIRISCAYYFIFTMILVVNSSSQIRNRLVYELTHDIQAERDEMETMKDNLRTGVFILDENYSIQPYYSHALTDILETKNLEGMFFIDILKNSVQKKRGRNTQRLLWHDYSAVIQQQNA